MMFGYHSCINGTSFNNYNNEKMATVKLLLEKSRALKDGTFSLVFQILHLRKKRLIYTPYKIYNNEYNQSEEKVVYLNDSIRSELDVIKINKLLSKQRKRIKGHISELEFNSIYSSDEIVFRYNMGNDTLTLLSYIDIQISLKQELGKLGTASAYKSTRASLSKFTNGKKVRISNIDARFVSEYSHFLLKNGVTQNTVCFYMRNLKSIYNQALINGCNSPKLHAFRNQSTSPQRTVKRAINLEDIKNIKSLDLSNNIKLDLARDIFMFSFYCRGMSFVDILYLTKLDIINNTISYSRHKTNQWLQISVTADIGHIISKYENSSNFIFPILSGTNVEHNYKKYRTELILINKNLKDIAKLANIETPLTTYVARHSWATQAKRCGAPTSIISEGLGHTNEKTTQIYLKQFDRSTLDLYNEKITDLLR